MPDRTIEILLQFKQLGQELLKQTNAQLKDLQKPAAAAGAAMAGLDSAGTGAAANLAKGLKEAGASGKAAGAEVESSWRKMLDSLKSTAGKGSIFKETLDLFLGGGVAIGISLLGTALAGAVQKAVALKQAFQDGDASVDDVILGVGAAIPMIGGFVEAGQGINELFTGAKAEAARMAKEITTAEARLKEFATTARAVRDTMREIQAFGRQLAGQLPHNAAQANVLQTEADKATIDAMKEASKRKIDDAYAKQLEEAQAVQLKAAKKMRDAIYYQDLADKADNGDIGAMAAVTGLGRFGTDEAANVRDAYNGTLREPGTKEALARLNMVQQNINGAKSEIDTKIKTYEKLLADLRTETSRRNAAQEEITRTQLLGTGSTGDDKAKLDANVAWLQQREAVRQAAVAGILKPGEKEPVLEKIDAQRQESFRHALAEMQITNEEFMASIEDGTRRQMAQAEVDYKKDVESWNEALFQKKVNQEQYDAAMIALTRQREAKIREIEFSRAQAQGAVNVLMLQSQHQATAAKLAAIDLETAASAEGYHRQAADGLITAEQYDAALEALQREAADKRLMVNGSFVDGMRIGFQTLEANMLTMAQIGSQVAGQIARGFGEAFSSMIMGTKSAAQAFGQMAVSILADLAKIFAEQAMVSALSPVFSIMTAGLAGAFGGMFGAGGTATAAGDAPMMGGAYGRGMATGGLIPGVDTGRDHVPVLARGGEFMVRPEAVRQPGILSMLQAINSGYPRMSLAGAAGSLQRFAEGGLVKAMAGAGGGGAGGLRVLPVLAADTNTARKLIGGNVNVLADVMRENVTLFAGILRNGGGG